MIARLERHDRDVDVEQQRQILAHDANQLLESGRRQQGQHGGMGAGLHRHVGPAGFDHLDGAIAQLLDFLEALVQHHLLDVDDAAALPAAGRGHGREQRPVVLEKLRMAGEIVHHLLGVEVGRLGAGGARLVRAHSLSPLWRRPKAGRFARPD